MDVRVGPIKKAERQRTMVLENTLENPLDYKEIKPVNPKGNQPWIFIGRAEAEAPIIWPPDAKNWLTGKDPNARKDWRQKEKGTTEEEMVGWHHWINGHKWASFGSWWWTGKPGMLQSMGSQRVEHDWATELNWMAVKAQNPNHEATREFLGWNLLKFSEVLLLKFSR